MPSWIWRRLARAFGRVAAWCWERAAPLWSLDDWGLRYRGRRFGQSEPQSWKDVVRADPCAYCGGPSETVEHVIPVSAGGKRSPGNEVGACVSCNASKSNTPLLRFLIEQHAHRPVHEAVERKRASAGKPPLTRRQREKFASQLRNEARPMVSRARQSGGHR